MVRNMRCARGVVQSWPVLVSCSASRDGAVGGGTLGPTAAFGQWALLLLSLSLDDAEDDSMFLSCSGDAALCRVSLDLLKILGAMVGRRYRPSARVSPLNASMPTHFL